MRRIPSAHTSALALKRTMPDLSCPAVGCISGARMALKPPTSSAGIWTNEPRRVASVRIVRIVLMRMVRSEAVRVWSLLNEAIPRSRILTLVVASKTSLSTSSTPPSSSLHSPVIMTLPLCRSWCTSLHSSWRWARPRAI